MCLCEEYLVILGQLETFHDLKAFGHIDHLQVSWSVACRDTSDLTTITLTTITNHTVPLLCPRGHQWTQSPVDQ